MSSENPKTKAIARRLHLDDDIVKSKCLLFSREVYQADLLLLQFIYVLRFADLEAPE